MRREGVESGRQIFASLVRVRLPFPIPTQPGMSFAGGTEEAGENGATEEAATHGKRRRLRRSERIGIGLVQVKRIVATRKCQPVKSALRTDNEKYETREQNSFGPVTWNSR